MNYKSPDNSLHFIEPEFAHLLPAGSVQITAEEAEALRPVPAPPTYKELRAAEYPPITDFLDGIVKGDESQIQAYKDACLAIKVKYPK
jgi:hypothetical protein